MNLNTFTILITLVIIFSIQAIAQPSPLLCPKALSDLSNVCERFKCVNNITKDDCSPDTFYIENLTLCGCCPGCAKYIGLPVPTPKSVPRPCQGPRCPIKVNQCMPGLIYNETTQFCSLPTTILDPCSQECMYKRSLKRLGEYHWDPECSPDGSYAPKQCKGDHVTGICFCVDKCGKRIFGQEFRVNAKNQTCECSRHVNNLRRTGKTATLHCTPQGNYEPLQCDTDSSTCFCVEEKDGQFVGAIVPEKMWNTLHCLTPNVTNFLKGGRYLRKCESHYAGNRRIINEGVDHSMEISLAGLNCDYDGSYAPLQVSGTRTECVYKNGTTIKDYFTSNVPDGTMDCNCARDEFLYRIKGRPFSFTCALQTGNFPNYFDYGSYASCVDRDGIEYGHLVPSKYTCCLDKTCIFSTGKECYHERDNRDGYRSCCSWPFGGYCST